ncbi:MAG: molybdopterin-dependent oxidoreductase [Gemmatimonadota bacterium]
MSPTVSLRVDGQPITVERGRTVFQAAERLGKTPPHFCYHRDLSVPANCRMCLCEIKDNPKLQTSCSMIAAEGMEVSFESARVREAVAGVLEFEFKNHPLDCPVCDQVGECKLQQYYMEVGLYESELETPKIRKDKVKRLGKITLDAERCVLCSRCVRFGNEVTGTNDFVIVNRSDKAEIATFDDRPITNPYSLNYADICPVGALTSTDFRFQRRVYYLDPVASVCPECSNGCSIFADRSLNQTFRFRPRVNPEVNDSWMCDEGRLSYKAWNTSRGRIERPLVRGSGRLVAASWERAVQLLAERMRAAREAGGRVAALAHPRMTNEDLFVLRGLVTGMGGEVEFRLDGVHLKVDAPEDRLLRKLDKNPNTRGAMEILLGREAAAAAPEAPEREPAAGFLQRIAAGGADVLLVARWDEDALGEAGVAAVERAGFVVFVGPWEPELSARCDLLLPSSRTGERDGTFTNFAGRVQVIREVLRPYGLARDPWAVLDAVGRELGMELAGASAAETFDRLAESVEAYRGLRFAELGSTGAWLGGVGGNGKGASFEPAGGGPADSGPLAAGAVSKQAAGGPGSMASVTGGRGAT